MQPTNSERFHSESDDSHDGRQETQDVDAFRRNRMILIKVLTPAKTGADIFLAVHRRAFRVIPFRRLAKNPEARGGNES